MRRTLRGILASGGALVALALVVTLPLLLIEVDVRRTQRRRATRA